MACYHPLKAWKIGYHDSGKPNYKITGYDVHHLAYVRGSWQLCYDVASSDKYYDRVEDFIEIPCGHCIGCRLKKSKEWAMRCLAELDSYHGKGCFVTLTYNDEHLPIPNKIIDNDGVVTDSSIHPLRKRDLQLFIKRLRKRFPDTKIRYYACGEYGAASMRCHYHIILFGVDFSEDRVFYKKSFDNKFNYYTSPSLDDLWHSYDEAGHDLGQNGFAVVTNVSFDTCAYVARYVTKKRYGAASEFYDKYAIPPEFSLMSRKPGLGRDYFDKNWAKIYKYDEIILSSEDGGRRFKPPRYYDKLFDFLDPLSFGALADKRAQIAEEHNKIKSNLTSLSYLDMLKSEEENLVAKMEHKGVNRKKV